MEESIPASTRQIAFLPWLRLKNPQHVAGVDFVPFRDSKGMTPDVLADAVTPISSILASYVDREGESIDNCVVVTISDRGWNLTDSDFQTVKWAAALLFLASWASNEYFPRWFGPYINSSSFRVVWQRFSGTPDFVTLVSRRRDGHNTGGGYKHGEVKFSLPLQCSLTESILVDEAFLKAIDRGNSENSVTLQRLRYALSFVALANTDDDLMDESAETILIGSAFEQLLGVDASSYKLGREFGNLFQPYGSVTVAKAKNVRSDIKIDASESERATAQLGWWVHRKWMEELYDVRSESVHSGTASRRTWGWTQQEHLVMAAWTFPLATKLLLKHDGHYTPTDQDEAHFLSIDKLLAAIDWAKETEDGQYKWGDIVATTAHDHCFEQSMKQFFE